MLKKIVLLLLILIAIAGFGWWKLRQPQTEDVETSLPTTTVQIRDIEVVAEAAGLVEPVRILDVKSNASGEVLRVLVETGDEVEAGALLAEIDPRDVQSTLDQARADLESNQVRLDTAAAELHRSQRLLEAGLLAAQEVEKAVEATASARAALVRTQTSLRLALEKRQDVTLRAPAAGTILERGVEPGQIVASATSNVSGGTTLFRMADLSAMQVRAKIDEVDIGRITKGQVARVSVEAYPGRVFEGTVAKIEPQAVVDQNVTQFPVLVRLANPGGLLRPGMNAEVTLEIALRPQATAVPNNAVVNLRDGRSIADLLDVELPTQQAGRDNNGPAIGPQGDTPPAAEDALQDCRALFQKMRSGGGPSSLSTEDRAALRKCREQLGGRDGGRRPGERRSGARGGQGEMAETAEVAEAGTGARPAWVFVETDGQVEARRVRLGVSDWEFSEVLEGLQADDLVVQVSVAQLQQRQRERSERIRRRFGGPLAGGNSNSRPSGRPR